MCHVFGQQGDALGTPFLWGSAKGPALCGKSCTFTQALMGLPFDQLKRC